MTAKDIFGIVIRVFGLSFTTYAIWYIVFGIASLAGLPEDAPGYLVSYFITGITFLGVGIYLLRGAPHVLRFAYPEAAGGGERP